MKTTDFITERSMLADGAQEMELDHEVQMARADCYHAAKYAIELHKMLKNISELEGLEGWVSEKITLANDYLTIVYEHLSHKMATSDEPEEFTLESAEAKFNQILESDVTEMTSAGVATVATGGSGKNTGSLFGGSYKQKRVREQQMATNTPQAAIGGAAQMGQPTDPAAMAKMKTQQLKQVQDQKKQLQDQIKQTQDQLTTLKQQLAAANNPSNISMESDSMMRRN